MSTLPAKGYLNIGIDTQVPWPAKETVVDFRGQKFHLLPQTDSVSRMIRVETATGFTTSDAERLILELVSSMAWAEQANAMTTLGRWSTAPLNIGKGPMGMIGDGHFDYLPDPQVPKAKLALALYREGLSVNLAPYQFLGFFKVVNILRSHPDQQMQWINDNLQHVIDARAKARLSEIQSTQQDVGKYLFVSGRCAISHAYAQPIVNPDDPADLSRINSDLPLMQELARIAIERELGIKSKGEFHRDHLYELQGFRTMFGDNLVARIKAREVIPAADVAIPKSIALRVRDRDRIELFESMDAEIVYVRDACVRIRLVSACQRLIVFVSLDFARESLISEPLTDLQFHDDGTPGAAKMMLQWALIHRWWFGGNGAIELWDKATDTRLARAQHYMPPVNSRFPHDEFEKMERELRARAGISNPPEDCAK